MISTYRKNVWGVLIKDILEISRLRLFGKRSGPERSRVFDMDVEKVTKEAIANGGVLAMLYFDVHAATKELVQELGTGFVNSLIGKEGVVYALGEIEEPVGGKKEKNWSSSVSVKILTSNFTTLAAICLTNSPFSVEILRPDEIKLQLSEAHSLLGTMSATTAEYKRYILTKVADPEDIIQMQQNLKKRADMGREILSKKDKG
jgi:hypothetical protein